MKCDFYLCNHCGRFQMNDHGNYLCWTCEDGKINKDEIPKWRLSPELKIEEAKFLLEDFYIHAKQRFEKKNN